MFAVVAVVVVWLCADAWLRRLQPVVLVPIDQCDHPIAVHSMTRMGRLNRRNMDNTQPAERPIRFNARRYSVVCKRCGGLLKKRWS